MVDHNGHRKKVGTERDTDTDTRVPPENPYLRLVRSRRKVVLGGERAWL